MFKKAQSKNIFHDPDIPYGPNDLWWPKKKDKQFSVKLLIVDEEKSNSMIIEQEAPPNEEELKQILNTAKMFSSRSGRTDVVFQRNERKFRLLEDGTKKEYTQSKTMKIARFREGEIELYCRPVWRKGPY